MTPNTDTVSASGHVESVRFVDADDRSERKPGTYMTIRLAEGSTVMGGPVEIVYLPSAEGDQ